MIEIGKLLKTGTETNAIRTHRKKFYGRRRNPAVTKRIRKASWSVCPIGLSWSLATEKPNTEELKQNWEDVDFHN